MFEKLFEGELIETWNESLYCEPTHSGYSEDMKLKSNASECAPLGATNDIVSVAQSSLHPAITRSAATTPAPRRAPQTLLSRMAGAMSNVRARRRTRSTMRDREDS